MSKIVFQIMGSTNSAQLIWLLIDTWLAQALYILLKLMRLTPDRRIEWILHYQEFNP